MCGWLIHFVTALSHISRTQARLLGAPTVPSVQWEDIGGLLEAKKDILDTIQLPLENPALFASGGDEY